MQSAAVVVPGSVGVRRDLPAMSTGLARPAHPVPSRDAWRSRRAGTRCSGCTYPELRATSSVVRDRTVLVCRSSGRGTALHDVTSEHGASHLDRVARLREGGLGHAAWFLSRRDDLVDDATAALLIRVWLEGAGEFRARLLTLGDDAAGTPADGVTVAVVSSPEDVLDAVRDWLRGFASQAGDPVDRDV